MPGSMNSNHPINYANYLGEQHDINYLTPPFGSTANNQSGFAINYHGPIQNCKATEIKPNNGLMRESIPAFTVPPLRLESHTLPAFNSTDAGEKKTLNVN